MVQRLRGQDLLFGGAKPLDFAPSSNKISDYWGGSCPPYNYPTGLIHKIILLTSLFSSIFQDHRHPKFLWCPDLDKHVQTF